MAVAALLWGPAYGGRLSCASQGAVKAQDSLQTSYSWPLIFRIYRTYERCDENVYFSEAFSTAIVKTLVKKWNTLADLQKCVNSDSTFLDFVLLHVDATADAGDIKQILANCTKNCPSRCSSICARLRARATRAAANLQELMEEQK